MDNSSNEENEESASFKEFGPITPDDKMQGYGSYFAQFFKRKSKGEEKDSPKKTDKNNEPVVIQVDNSHTAVTFDSCSSNNLRTLISDLNAAPEGVLASLSMDELSHERNLPNVLKKIKHIIDKKGSPPQQYKDSDFKQYWLPDHLSKECYDCNEKFTPLRRRHHCRVCGQIFCSKCCNRLLPGRIIGYKGNLRVCTYCYKVVYGYLQSSNLEEEVLADLDVFREDFSPHPPASKLSSVEGSGLPTEKSEYERQITSIHAKRKPVFGFMEENYTVKSRRFSSDFGNGVDKKQLEQIASERQLLLKDSQQLQSLWSVMVSGPNKLTLSTNRHRLKSFPETFIGRDFVQWLLDNDKASSRQSAIAIGQALLEAGFVFCVSQADQIFVDEHVLYKTLKVEDFKSKKISPPLPAGSQDTGREPLWLKQIPSQAEEENVDLEACKGNGGNPSEHLVNISASSSNYSLDLNIQENFVSLKNPVKKRSESGQDVGDGFQTSVSASLNDTLLSHVAHHSTGTVIADEILEGLKTLEPRVAEARAAWWQQQNQVPQNSSAKDEEVDEQTIMSLGTQKRFNDLWSYHEDCMLMFLLETSGLDLSWSRTMIPLIYKVVDTVRPDVKNESDEMDIRQYIQFKKVPCGKRNECRIVNGTVCSKNVPHRSMKTRFNDPQILIIGSHIDYHKSTGAKKGLSINDDLVKEEEYVKKVVAAIMTYKPDILITAGIVSYIAREYLRSEGLTVIMNVKTSVIERISRCTQAQVVPSMDDLLQGNDLPHRPLGMCHSFFIRQFIISSNSSLKNLMFFDGCATHLGCTIILRGGSNIELKRVKRIMYFMIFALYNWKLERSFLMDEFASVPPWKRESRGLDPDVSSEKGVVGVTVMEGRGSGTCVGSRDENKVHLMEEPSTPTCIEADKDQGELKYPSHSTPAKVKEGNVVSDYSDPLHACLSSSPVDEIGDLEKQKLSEAEVPFSRALENTILSISPYIKYSIPFLETKDGADSPLRKFFPQEIYFSDLLKPKSQDEFTFLDPLPKDDGTLSVEYLPNHHFITSKITRGAADNDLRATLSDYRARGGTIRKICRCEGANQNEADKKVKLLENGVKKINKKNNAKDKFKETFNSFHVTGNGKVDSLHPYNHQRISLLFTSFSHSFHYTSVFCVKPRVLTMDFYGRNDIPLGAFLERYCFSPTYRCLSDSCQTPSLRHVRKFVHENGCVEILLRKMDGDLDDTNSSTIYTWSWCKKCREVSPVVPLSSDTWIFSFAKYLEIRFHETAISRRGTPGCSHSIHQQHFHYFGQKNLIAILKYSTIPTRELVIPPAEIAYVLNVEDQSAIVDRIKNVAIQGYNLFAAIVDRLSTITEASGEKWNPLLKSIAAHHNQQRQIFRETIENIQLQLTSPPLKQQWSNPPSPTSKQEVAALMHGISDKIVLIKRLVAQAVNDWNSKVQDLMNLKKKEEKERNRNNSGTQSKQAVEPSSLAGPIEHFHAPRMAEEVTPVQIQYQQTTPQTGSSEYPNDSQTTQDHDEEAVEASTAFQGTSSDENGVENLLSCAQTLQEERENVIKGIDYLGDSPSLPMFGAHFSRSAAEAPPSSASSKSTASFFNSGTEKDVSGGMYAALGSHPPGDLCHKRSISNSSDTLTSPIRTGLEHLITSPKTLHDRTQSDDGEITLAKEAMEKIPEKRYNSSVKSIISTLWSSSADLMIKSPFDQNEHYILLEEVKVPVVIYEEEPSSIIAMALASQEYESQFLLLQKRLNESSSVAENKSNENANSSQTPTSNTSQEGAKTSESEKPSVPQKDQHIEIQWSDQNANFYCKILYAKQFDQLRQLLFPFGEELYIRSLSRCIFWDARGGKSGSFFCKTTDDRFVLKEMSRFEINSFAEFAPAYIKHITNCKTENIPTALTRIVGVYRVGYKNTTTGKALKLDLLVMENLFYQRNIGPKFDLKGSVRNRKVNMTGKEESEVVLLDENLLQMACSSPFYLRPHGKDVLTRAVVEDSAFLAQQLIMDYSLLVGVDEDKDELVVGIIDYIRTFTWDKKLETIFKGSVLGAGTGKLPTVISPELYRNRFCHAMESYFVLAPDRWSSLGFQQDPS